MLIGDILAAVLALFLSLYVWSLLDAWLGFNREFLSTRVPNWFFFLPLIWIFLLIESYTGKRQITLKDSLLEIGLAAGISLVTYLVVFFIFPDFPRVAVIYFILFAVLCTLPWRAVFVKLFSATAKSRRALIVGAGKAGNEIGRILSSMNKAPFITLGYIDDDKSKLGEDIHGIKVIGTGDQFWDIISREQITDIIFAIVGEMRPALHDEVMEAEEKGIEVTTMPTLYEDLLGRIPVYLLKADWILRSFVDQTRTSFFYELVKRLMDILGAIFLGAITIITFPFVALAIVIDSGLPIFYSQYRLGKNGEPYKMHKLRTMYQDAEKDGIARQAVENDTRRTKVGGFLRRTHLDELPQFVNILKGEMSLVGPRSERPELVEELQVQIPFYRTRLFVKPGLTGWAQVNFGYASTLEMNARKLEYDLYYIKHRNLILDISILLRTIANVVGFKGN